LGGGDRPGGEGEQAGHGFSILLTIILNRPRWNWADSRGDHNPPFVSSRKHAALPFPSVGAIGRLLKSPFRGLFPGVAASGPWTASALPASEWPGGKSLGLAVVGHGTADPVGAEETRQVAALVAGMLPHVAVEVGFLEVIGPSIGEALGRLAARGCTEVVAAPLLLFTAGHARRDVPEAVRDGAARAGLVVRQSDALGCHPDILALTRQRRREALAPLAPVPEENTVLLMIGRGSSDPTAHRQLHDFAVLSCQNGENQDRENQDRENQDHANDPARFPGSVQTRIELGFVAAARPTLDEAIENAAAAAGPQAGNPGVVRRVVVQPHLLFRGHVEEQVTAAVDRARRAHPGIEWIQAGRLGADLLVARALIDRAVAAIPAHAAS
jgi:sirohydrochlorin cobaltochelatase